jgi:hypothetical protein
MAKCGKQARFYQETATAINKDPVIRFRVGPESSYRIAELSQHQAD